MFYHRATPWPLNTVTAQALRGLWTGSSDCIDSSLPRVQYYAWETPKPHKRRVASSCWERANRWKMPSDFSPAAKITYLLPRATRKKESQLLITPHIYFRDRLLTWEWLLEVSIFSWDLSLASLAASFTSWNFSANWTCRTVIRTDFNLIPSHTQQSPLLFCIHFKPLNSVQTAENLYLSLKWNR